MTAPLSNVALRRIFTVGTLATAVAFLVFFGYVHVAFSDALIGDVRSDTAPNLLKGLQSQKFEAAVSRLEARKALPDLPAELANPFDAPKR